MKNEISFFIHFVFKQRDSAMAKNAPILPQQTSFFEKTGQMLGGFRKKPLLCTRVSPIRPAPFESSRA